MVEADGSDGSSVIDAIEQGQLDSGRVP